MKYNQLFRLVRKSLGDFRKWLLAGNSHRGFAIIPVPSTLSLESDAQLRAQIIQLLTEGYRVTIVPAQEQTKCECCCPMRMSCAETLICPKVQMPLKESAL